MSEIALWSGALIWTIALSVAVWMRMTLLNRPIAVPPSTPLKYRLADDISVPLVDVVCAAEDEAGEA